MIDAESEYEGKYVAAQTYMTQLRKLIGPDYPVALAGFPYVDFHPAFPYSVFLGPGGAQYNAPQMYWRDIGASVDIVYAHTYAFNRPTAADRPARADLQTRRRPPDPPLPPLARGYRAAASSWWDWQEGNPARVPGALDRTEPLSGFIPDPSWPRSRRAPRATSWSGPRSI